jgi:hypothetical protein
VNRRGFLGALLAVAAAPAAVWRAPLARPELSTVVGGNGLLAAVDDGTYISAYHGIDRGIYCGCLYPIEARAAEVPL